MTMGTDVIKSLQSKLADLTYTLFVIRNEFEQIIQKSDDNKVKEELGKLVAALEDSNDNVIRLFHVIKSNEDAMRDEWYSDDADLHKLKQEVDNLSKSVDEIVESNKDFIARVLS